MSQKINPINNKLGTLQTWNYQFQKYGRTFKSYNKFVQPKNYILTYIKYFLFQNNLLIKNINLTYTIQQITINVFIFNLKYQLLKLEEKIILDTISYWLNCPIKLLIYQTNELDTSSTLLNNYILYLFSSKTISIKQILYLVFNILKKHSEKIKFIHTIKGLQLVKFRGLKLEFTGCFESSRSQMSKTIKYNFGSIPLTKLNGYVEYSNNRLFTKFGSCGLKLWLFYELL